MIKIRIEGLPADCLKACEALKRSFDVYQVSGFYPNRNSKYGRVYLEGEPLEPSTKTDNSNLITQKGNKEP